MKTPKRLFKDCPVFSELDPNKNDIAALSLLFSNSREKVSWVCEKGHEWEMTIAERAMSRAKGCVYCSNKVCIVGFNDLATHFPALVSEWHPTKNGKLTPFDVMQFSGKDAWWLCAKGHEWKSTIVARTASGRNCKLCTNTKKGSVAEHFPGSIKIWHHTKNGGLTPFDIAVGSKQKYWWVCENEHLTQEFPRNVIRGLKCESCAPGSATLWQEMKGLLHPTKNQGINIEEVRKSSAENLIWLCENSHEWVCAPKDQIHRGVNCPQCTKSIVFKAPEIATVFHPSKNGNLTAYDITKTREGALWWQCENGHEWKEKARTLQERDVKCIFCTTSILFTHPKIAAFWHPTKNENLDLKYFTKALRDRVWWQCANGHEWMETFHTFNKRGDCKSCMKAIVRTHPEVAACFHPTRNTSLKIENLTIDSPEGVWWRCENQHEWFSQVKNFEHDCALFIPESQIEKVIPNVDTFVAPTTDKDTIAVFWDAEKNIGIPPESVSPKSNERFHWVCVNGHEWEAGFAYQQKKMNTCTKCERVLLFSNPELSALWHPTKNGTLTPFDVNVKSTTIRPWWQCANGHEWQSIVSHENSKQEHCKFCVGFKTK